MKRIFLLAALAFGVAAQSQETVLTPEVVLPSVIKGADDPIVLDDDITVTREHLPPGHAKKRDGAKSARDYAPGQLKKHDRSWKNKDRNTGIFEDGTFPAKKQKQKKEKSHGKKFR